VFLIRQSKPEDNATLFKLARMVYFINLPPDEQIIAQKIEHSQGCFRRVAHGAADAKAAKMVKSVKKGKLSKTETTPPTSNGSRRKGAAGGGLAAMEHESDMFMFSVIEPETGAVIGTSQVRAHQGGPGNPNWRMRVGEKKFHSPSLGFGTTHTVAQLDGDTSGPSEVGGLIMQPSHRGHKLRPGRFLSFVRFHFMGLHRGLFAPTVLAEMMPPVTSQGDNLFWDTFGRKFIPVKYAEADRFCQHNRAFISDLLPKDEIYLTLFPLEVQNMVGVVSRETIPARRLLESLGFKYRGYIDPFDGGPHIDAITEQIPLVAATRMTEVGKATTDDRCTTAAIVSTLDGEGEFRATETFVEVTKDGPIRLTQEAMELLGVQLGSQLGMTAMGKFGLTREVEANPVKRRLKRAKV
jgi:arginine N-succinyltransferase